MCLSFCEDDEADMLVCSASAANGSWSWSSVGDGVERVVPGGVPTNGEGGDIISSQVSGTTASKSMVPYFE